MYQFNSNYKLLKFDKKIPFIYFDKNNGYRPHVRVFCKRIKGKSRPPYFDIPVNGIKEDGFFIFHEKVNLKNFEFYYYLYPTSNITYLPEPIKAKFTYRRKYTFPLVYSYML